jgi:preprotein translocase subunit YajC
VDVGDTEQVFVWLIFLVLLGVMMFLPQWRARRRHKKQMEELRPGDQVVTVGGILGTLRMLDAEQGRARLEIASGVQIEVLPAAIGRKVNES